MRIGSIKAIAAAALFLVLPYTSHAATIFNFSGTFSEASGSLQPILSPFFGQTFSGWFTVASPENQISVNSSTTLFELGASSFTVGSDTWTADNGFLQQQVAGPSELTFWGTDPAFGNAPSFSGPTVTVFQIPVSEAFFIGFGPDLFSDVNSLADFDETDLTTAFFGLLIDDTQLRGTVSTLQSVQILSATVPVPAALPLLLTALAGLGFLGARRQARCNPKYLNKRMGDLA